MTPSPSWKTIPLPLDEFNRLMELDRYKIVDTPPEQAFDDLVRLAAYICDAPIAMVSIVTEDRQWFKAKLGLDADETSRDVAFCAHAILDDKVMIVNDAREDDRFRDNPLVVGDPNIRFYAGAPLISPNGFRLGTLCVIDSEPRRQLDLERIEALESLARLAVEHMEDRLTVKHLENSIRVKQRSIEAVQLLQEIGHSPKADSLEDLIGYALDRILRITHWPYGEGWFRDSSNKLRQGVVRSIGPIEDWKTMKLVSQSGEGLIGGAWRSRIPSVVRDLDAEPNFLRKDEARALNLGAALRFPILSEENVVAVICCFLDTVSDVDEDSILLVDAVAAQLGRTAQTRLAEEALRASEERFRELFESSSDLIQSVDHQGRFIYVNPAWHRALGYDIDELEALSAFDVIHPDDFDRCIQLFQAMKPDTTIKNVDVRFVSKDRRTLSLLGNVTARLEKNGSVATRSSFRDITERKIAQEALAAIKKSFVATVSHELRTPLTSLKGSLGLITAGVMGDIPEEARQAIGVALRNTNRLVALVNDILDFEKIQAGMLTVDIKPERVEDLLRRAVESVMPFARQEEIEIEVESCEGMVAADSGRIEQVIINLLSNAIKFSPKGETVRARSRRTESGVEFEIIDRGRGIADEDKHLFFKPFQQIDSSEARHSGTGLGLVISRRIVEAHQGQIGIDSQPGKGSRFWFEIPKGLHEGEETQR